MICAEATAWLTLSFLPGLGCTRIAQLVDRWGSPEAVLAHRQDIAAESQAFKSILGQSGALHGAYDQAQRELDRLERQGIHLVSCQSPEYPGRLASIADRPVLLYVKGEPQHLTAPMLAIIGARNASSYGLRVARRFTAGVVAQGLAVVSGAAYGIDTAAHQETLRQGGLTLAVLGCGVDVVYPPEHRRLLAEIAERGAVISEFPLGTKPESFRFPIRNRIISGLARAILVVEAGEKSGSLITARLGLDQGREVLAVPGPIDSPRSSGSHWLINQGALLAQSPDDVLAAMNWQKRSPAQASMSQGLPSDLSPQARKLMQLIDQAPRDIDELAELCALGMTELQPLLLQLELQGLVRRQAGQLYERC